MAAKKKRARRTATPTRKAKPRKRATPKRARATVKKAAGRARPKQSKRKPAKSDTRSRTKKVQTKAKRKASKSAPKRRPAKRPSKASKKQAKRKAPKPRRPKKTEEVSLFWQGYFHEALAAIKEQLERTTGIKLPAKVKTWRNEERADAILTVDISQAPDAARAVQKALGDNMIDYLTQGGFFVSFAYAGKAGLRGSPTLMQAGQTAETWPTQNVASAIETAEGTRNIEGVLRKLEPFLEIEQIKLRLHWNPFGEQPERMG